MPENVKTDWRAIAQARGIPASDAVVKSLETLDQGFAAVRAMLGAEDEPILQPVPENQEPAQ